MKHPILTAGQLNEAASHNAVEALEHQFGVRLPDEYLNFLRNSNGGEGFVGVSYIIMWKAEELEELNRAYDVNRYAPGIILFASSGGGEGFGFDTRVSNMPIISVPFIGMSLRYVKFIAAGMGTFFSALRDVEE